jgi:hypothetical protein
VRNDEAIDGLLAATLDTWRRERDRTMLRRALLDLLTSLPEDESLIVG